MPKIWVKDAGTWKQVLLAKVKSGGSWVTPQKIYVKNGGTWKQAYPDTLSTTTYSSPGTYTYTVPAGITSLQIRYPTVSGLTTSTISVTPGASYTVTIGSYGSGSSFGGLLSTSAYDKTILGWSGNVDAEIYVTVGSGTASGNTYSGSGNASTLSSGASAAGCYYAEASEGWHGDLNATIGITTALSATFVNSLQATVTNFSGRGGSAAYVSTQPSSGNSYQTTVYAYDSDRGEGGQSWNILLQQIVSLTILGV